MAVTRGLKNGTNPGRKSKRRESQNASEVSLVFAPLRRGKADRWSPSSEDRPRTPPGTLEGSVVCGCRAAARPPAEGSGGRE